MPKVNCKICNSVFYAKPRHLKIGWGKYCSKQCQYEGQKTGDFLPCKICNKLIWRSQKEIRKSPYKNFFCSKSCQAIWRNKTYIEQNHRGWINGISTYRNIIKRRNIKQICKNCGITDMRVLIVHHIDHNRTNNNIKNLKWLCRNCHYLVHKGKTF
jgi:hypothetical protein